MNILRTALSSYLILQREPIERFDRLERVSCANAAEGEAHEAMIQPRLVAESGDRNITEQSIKCVVVIPGLSVVHL